MIHLEDGEFASAELSDEDLSQDEPATSLELRRLVPPAGRTSFFLRLESEETAVTMYANDELLLDLRNVIDTALGGR